MSEKAQAMINELVSVCIAFGRQVEPDWQTRIDKAQRELREYIAELEEQAWNLNLENERMEEAYWIDESIAPDGTLKPSVRKLLERLEKAETDLRLGDDLVKALDNRIAELEAEVTELKPYRDGYDAYEDFPEEGENVIANLGIWLFLAQRRGDKWYDSLGQQAEIRGGVERWWKLPEVTE